MDTQVDLLHFTIFLEYNCLIKSVYAKCKRLFQQNRSSILDKKMIVNKVLAAGEKQTYDCGVMCEDSKCI